MPTLLLYLILFQIYYTILIKSQLKEKPCIIKLLIPEFYLLFLLICGLYYHLRNVNHISVTSYNLHFSYY